MENKDKDAALIADAIGKLQECKIPFMLAMPDGSKIHVHGSIIPSEFARGASTHDLHEFDYRLPVDSFADSVHCKLDTNQNFTADVECGAFSGTLSDFSLGRLPVLIEGPISDTCYSDTPARIIICPYEDFTWHIGLGVSVVDYFRANVQVGDFIKAQAYLYKNRTFPEEKSLWITKVEDVIKVWENKGR